MKFHSQVWRALKQFTDCFKDSDHLRKCKGWYRCHLSQASQKLQSCQGRLRLSMCTKKISHSHKAKFFLCISFLWGGLHLTPLCNILRGRMISDEGVSGSFFKGEFKMNSNKSPEVTSGHRRLEKILKWTQI